MANSGTIELVARELGALLEPLGERLSPAGAGPVDLLAQLGLRLPEAVAGHAGFVAAVNTLAGDAAALEPLVTNLGQAIDAGDEAQMALAGVAVIVRAGQVIGHVHALQAALQAAAGASPATVAELNAQLPELPERLIDFLIVEYLGHRAPALLQVLVLIGLADDDEVLPAPGSALAVPHVRHRLHLDRLGNLLSNPAAYLGDTYGWGRPTFDGKLLFERLRDFLDRYEYPVALIEPPGAPRILEAYLASLQVQPGNPPSLALRVRFQATQDFSRSIPIAPPWSLRVGAKARFGAGMGGSLTPPLQLSLQPPTAGASLEASAALAAEDGGRPMVVLGKPGGSRLQVRRFSTGVGVVAKLEGGALKAEPAVDIALEGGKLVIDLSEGDGFITSILQGLKIESDFAMSLRWTPSRGVVFVGGAALELVVPLHLNLGPVEVQQLYVLLGFGTPAPVSLGVATALKVQIGPFGLAVDKIGFDLPMRFPADRRGNLGPLDMGFAFRPPTGIGVEVKAGPISGGGFLSIDVPNGRYAGVLQLGTPIVAVTAIGLLDTRMPEGGEGFSLLIIVSVELPPIQLGFGFTLTGVGGLAGMHRTVATDVLRQGIRTGALNNIMFPRDPVTNAPAIIASLRSIFPPARYRFVFGPFLRIGWGTPSLVTGALGVILELPDPVRILILGQLKVTIPVPELPLVSLNLDVLGIIDFGEKMLSIDASLYDSRVTVFSVYGDMALRLSWGSPPIFALSMGGLHPQFRPPPNFPELRRLTIELGLDDNPRLTCQSYFALTANSVQFGARVEAYASAAGFSIHGWLGYDALVIFVPFSFVVDIDAGVQLKRGSTVIAGIQLEGQLSGPNPWKVRGRASLSLFFFDVSVPVKLQIGDEQTQPVPTLVAWDQLRAALADGRNWQGLAGAGPQRALSFAAPADAAGKTFIDPASGLAVQQKVLPLNLQLDKLGEARIDGPSRFDVSHARIGTSGAGFVPRGDFFASGQYLDLNDAQKLSRDSYELMDAGVAFGGDALAAGNTRGKDLVYERIIIDKPEDGGDLFTRFKVRQLATATVTAAQFDRMAARTRIDLAPRPGLERYAPAPGAAPRIQVDDEAWGITSADTLAAHAQLGQHRSRAAAEQALRDWKRANPGDAGRWQVLPAHELEAG
ncbi:hypothetical protein QTH90_30175 [Variovorax sp. J2P1-59]|uniref:DUF6603 domain-containing protein n=1 Tax=Variovorax flavidus TaxID=3053501 RepID=UPI0025759140|nr:DUF6603 domain-containing protein [Variovorax sp. J2P1-59]MDM0078709.1 hypothetical protein [Variovorax sp. J2P1-59]